MQLILCIHQCSRTVKSPLAASLPSSGAWPSVLIERKRHLPPTNQSCVRFTTNASQIDEHNLVHHTTILKALSYYRISTKEVLNKSSVLGF